MLRGFLYYNDERLGSVVYEVRGRASMEHIALYLTPTVVKATMLYEPEVFTRMMNKEVPLELLSENTWDYLTDNESDRAVSVYDGHTEIHTANPSVVDHWRSMRINLNGNKVKTNITNQDFAVEVAALIRGTYVTGERKVGVSETGFTPFASVSNPKTGFVETTYGVISRVRVVNKKTALFLDEFDSATEKSDMALFTNLKQKDKFGNELTHHKISIFGYSSDLYGGDAEVVKRMASSADNSGVYMYETIEDVIRDNPNKQTDWILSCNYRIVSDEELPSVIGMFNQAVEDGKPVAYDTETSGLKINFKSASGEADQLVGVVLSIEEGSGYYFPLQHKKFKNLCGGDHAYFMDRYMKPILENGQIICHNCKFDWAVTYIYGIVLNCVFDTMTAFGVTKKYELGKGFLIGLKTLVRQLFGLDMFDLSDFVIGDWASAGIAFWDLPYELVRRYAPADADMTLRLYNYLVTHRVLENYNAKRTFDLEVNFAKATSYSEFFGYHVATDEIPQLNVDIDTAIEKYKAELYAMAGYEFNPNSSPQLTRIMYDELGIPPINNQRSTKKEILKDLGSREGLDGEPLYPFAAILKKYRDVEGIRKNFLKRLPEFATSDGFIFPDVDPIGTTTGRITVKEPNYQSYNDAAKQRIKPRKGYYFMDSDFKQIESRVLASMAHEEKLIEAFEDPDMDYHTYQSSRMFSVPYALVEPEMRQASKGINFGLPYGMGDPSLGARIFGSRSPENTRKATKLRKLFFQGQENIERFFEVVRDDGVKNGYTETMIGRRRYYFKGEFTEAEIRRQAGNHVIQGTAADIFKIAVCNFFNRCIKEGWLGLVLFNVFVHDETLFEVSELIAPQKFMTVWREEYELNIEGFTKLFAGAGFGNSWYEAKKQDLDVQYIDYLITSYDEANDNWNGDFASFLEKVDIGQYMHNWSRVTSWLLDKENDNKPMKAAVGQKMTGCVIDEVMQIVKTRKVCLQSGERVEISNERYNSILKILGSSAKGNFNALKNEFVLTEKGKWTPQFTLEENIALTALIFDIPVSEFVTVVEEKSEVSNVMAAQDSDLEGYEADYVELSPEEQIRMVLKSIGYYLDTIGKKMYLNINNGQIATYISQNFCKPDGMYAVIVMTADKDGVQQMYETPSYIRSEDIMNIYSLYSMSFVPQVEVQG